MTMHVVTNKCHDLLVKLSDDRNRRSVMAHILADLHAFDECHLVNEFSIDSLLAHGIDRAKLTLRYVLHAWQIFIKLAR